MALHLELLRRRDPPAMLLRLARDYPRVAPFRLGPPRVYLLNHPELITSLLVHQGRATRKGRILNKIRIVLGDGLLTSEGDFHARQRRLIAPPAASETIAPRAVNRRAKPKT